MPKINPFTERRASIEDAEQATQSGTTKPTDKSSRNPLVRLRIWLQSTALYLWAHGLYLRIKTFFKKDDVTPPPTQPSEQHATKKHKGIGSPSEQQPHQTKPSATASPKHKNTGNRAKRSTEDNPKTKKGLTIKENRILSKWNPWAKHSLKDLSGCTTPPSIDDLLSSDVANGKGAMANTFDTKPSIDHLSNIISEGMNLLNDNARESLEQQIGTDLGIAHEKIINICMEDKATEQEINDAFRPFLELTDFSTSNVVRNIHHAATLLKNQMCQSSTTNEINNLMAIGDKMLAQKKAIPTNPSRLSNPSQVIDHLLNQALVASLDRMTQYIRILINMKAHKKQGLLYDHLLMLQSKLSIAEKSSLSRLEDRTDRVKNAFWELDGKKEPVRYRAAAMFCAYNIVKSRLNKDNNIVPHIVSFLKENFEQIPGDSGLIRPIDGMDIKNKTTFLASIMQKMFSNHIRNNTQEQQRLVQWSTPKKTDLYEQVDKLCGLKTSQDWPQILHQVAKEFGCEKAIAKMK